MEMLGFRKLMTGTSSACRGAPVTHFGRATASYRREDQAQARAHTQWLITIPCFCRAYVTVANVEQPLAAILSSNTVSPLS